MEIKLAGSAGFCFGVDRAVTMVNDLLKAGKKVATLGPIIHNNQVTDDLARKGAIIVDKVSECPKGYTLVVRSHSVAKEVYDEIEKSGLQFVDATCPFVTKIQKLVEEHCKDSVILIAGDKEHPEVKSINSFSGYKGHIFSSLEELEKMVGENPAWNTQNITAVAQTTFQVKKWKICTSFLKKVCTNAVIFDTICSATEKRQAEALELAQKSDLMVVIGGFHSSNTQKLKEVCQRNCPTILVETAEQLAEKEYLNAEKIGVTAGASTPDAIIKEVLCTMNENATNNIEGEEEEFDFEQALEASLKPVHRNQKITGVVTSISANEVQVDIGTKHTGFIPLSELSNDSSAKAEDLVKKGDELELIVLKVNDAEGTVMLSKKRHDSIAGFSNLVKAHEENTVLEGKITDILKGGVLAVAEGMKVFIPASHVSLHRVENLEDLKGDEVKFKIIDIDQGKKRAVASIKEVLNEERKELVDKFWEQIEVGQEYKGVVKNIMPYGVFVDLGSVDGMVHISELSWVKIKHPSEVVKEGDTLDVYVKDLDKENRKISLGHKKTDDNPWVIFERDYSLGDEVDAKIVSITSFGAFAQILPGVDGLIHISQIANQRVDKISNFLTVGDEVKAKLIEMDLENKRISLSIRALLKEEEKDEEQSIVEEYNAKVEAEEAAQAPAEEEVLKDEAEAVLEEVGVSAEVEDNEVAGQKADAAEAETEEE